MVTNITDTEWEDFENALKKYRRKGVEFYVEESVHPAQPVTGGYIRGTVTVTHKPTAFNKTYKAGTGSSWVVEFDDDLAGGLYKS